MTIDISRENERILGEIVASGRFSSREEAMTAAIRLLRDKSVEIPGTHLSASQWQRAFERHLVSTPLTGAQHVDDNRESIYQGRE